MELYIQAQSKKAINEAIANGHRIIGTNYSIFGGGGTYVLNECPAQTIVKVFKKYVGGQPYATAYGTWNGKKLI